MGGGASKQKLEELKKKKEKDRKDGISKRINFILNNKNLTKEQQIQIDDIKRSLHDENYSRSDVNDLKEKGENEIFNLITQYFGEELDNNEIGASYGEGGHGSGGGRKKRKRKTMRKRKKSSTRKRKRNNRKSKKKRKKR